jgi:hypothetical protein
MLGSSRLGRTSQAAVVRGRAPTAHELICQQPSRLRGLHPCVNPRLTWPFRTRKARYGLGMAYIAGDLDFVIQMQPGDGGDIMMVTGAVAAVSDDLDLCATGIAESWGDSTSISSEQTTRLNLLSVTVTTLDGSLLQGFSDFSSADNDTGQADSDPVETAVAGIATKLTGHIGRKNRGRMYIPGLQANGCVTDRTRWSGSFVTAMQTRVDAFVALLLASDAAMTYCVNSRSQHELLAVSSMVYRPYFGTQRRRVTLS